MNKYIKMSCFIVLMLASISFASAVPSRLETKGETIANSDMEWSYTFGGTADDAAQSVIQTADGGYAIAGWTESYSAGIADMWLVKTDANGQHEWNHTYGDIIDDWAHSLIQTTDGGFILAGGTTSYGAGDQDIWMVKTDANGQHEWNHTYGGTDADIFRSVINTVDGGFALLGGTNSYGAGSEDAWLVKTDVNGLPEWNHTYGGGFGERGLQIIQMADEGYTFVGGTWSYGAGGINYWLVKTDATGQHEWNKTYGGSLDDFGNCFTQTADGGFALAGGTKSYGAGGYDFWLVKTDVSGQHEWNNTFGSDGSEGHCLAVIQTADGGFTLAGETTSWGAGNQDFWLVKTDTNGQHEWNKTYGGISDEWANSMIQTTDGGFVLAGVTTSYGAGKKDFWFIKTSTSEDTTTTTTITTTETAAAWTSLTIYISLSALIIFRKRKTKT
ncbi:MAG: hypothetical protein ACXADH_14400 [Candidatus Kariarchaeaceae archaeon]|jgi:hypothetical protein